MPSLTEKNILFDVGFYMAWFLIKIFRLLPPTADKEAVTKALTGFSSYVHEPTYSYKLTSRT